MSPGRLEIGEEEGLREKQIKGTQVFRFCHVLERPVMKAIYIYFGILKPRLEVSQENKNVFPALCRLKQSDVAV